MPTSPEPARPVPASTEQFGLSANDTFVLVNGGTISKIVWAVVIMSLPSQGDVVDPIAPQRDAVSTDICKRLSTHTIQPNCMMPMMNAMTGKATKANSTAVAPRLFLKKFILLNAKRDCGRVTLRRGP